VGPAEGEGGGEEKDWKEVKGLRVPGGEDASDKGKEAPQDRRGGAEGWAYSALSAE